MGHLNQILQLEEELEAVNKKLDSFDGLLEACKITVKILESIPNIASLLSAQENIDLYTALDKSGQAIAQAEE